MKKFFIFTLLGVLLISSLALAQNKLEASLESTTTAIGEPVYLYLTFSGSSNVPEPTIPAIDGLKIKRIGSSTEMSVVNGVITQSITYTYLVIPGKGGHFDIGPFFVQYEGKEYRAIPVPLLVDQGPASQTSVTRRVPSQPTATTAPRPQFSGSDVAPYRSDKIFLTMEIEKRTIYINEMVPVTIKLYVEGMGLKDIEYPVYSHEGFSAGEFTKPERKRENFRGMRYDTLEFRQDLFGIKEGDYVLGPATLSCKMLTRKQTSGRRSSIFGVSVFIDDPFSSGFQSYPIELESNEIPVTILPFPAKDKPKNFKGAVGNFNFDAEIIPSEVKVGDPITLKMTISGYGNLDTVTAPEVKVSDKFKIYEPQVTKKGSRKIYEQILIPKTVEVKEVPKVSFSFFNPIKKKYETDVEGPFKINVAEQPESSQGMKMVTMPLGEHVFYPKEEIGEDIIHIKESLGTIYPEDGFIGEKWYFWFFQVLFLLAFVGFYFTYRKRERIRTDRGYARLLKAPKRARKGLQKAKNYLAKNDTLKFYDAIHGTLEEYLGNKFNLPKGSVTSKDLEKRLSSLGCDEDILNKLKDVFSKCEMARYASSISEEQDHEKVLEEVRKIIDYVEKMRI